MDKKEKKSEFFTVKTKRFFALGAIGFVILWLILWYIFPMEWYSIFFASTIGSFVQLCLLATVLILPLCYILTAVSGKNIPAVKNYFINLVFMVGIVFLFSIFRYSRVYLIIIAVILHAAAMVWVIYPAKSYKKVKLIKTEKQPLIAAAAEAVLHTLIINAANIFLFWNIAFIYSEYTYN